MKKEAAVLPGHTLILKDQWNGSAKADTAGSSIRNILKLYGVRNVICMRSNPVRKIGVTHHNIIGEKDYFFV
jgi:hypothetical protein